MRIESKKYSGLEHVPACSTWPPPWLIPSTPTPAPPPVATVLKLPEPPPDVSSWDLTPDQYERWAERVCIMHYDAKLPWPVAERLALADVLGQADPPAKQREAGPAPEGAQEAAAVVQGRLFAAERGPYA